MKKSLLLMASCLLALLLSACGGGEDEVQVSLSSGKTLVSYSISSSTVTMAGRQVQVLVPYGTDITHLTPLFDAAGARVTVNGVVQVSGVSVQDFSAPVNYTVTAEDGSSATYTVTVIVAPSSVKTMSAFSLGGVVGVVSGQNIAVTLPYGSDPTVQVASFSTLGSSVAVNGVPQSSGVTVQDFSAPVTYVVTAADGSTASYIVTVAVAPSSAKAITSYSILGAPGDILQQGPDQYRIDVPYYQSSVPTSVPTNVMNVTPAFMATGVSVTLNGVPQTSGVTSVNIAPLLGFGTSPGPLVYVVTAADGSTATYTLTMYFSIPPTQLPLEPPPWWVG